MALIELAAMMRSLADSNRAHSELAALRAFLGETLARSPSPCRARATPNRARSCGALRAVAQADGDLRAPALPRRLRER